MLCLAAASQLFSVPTITRAQQRDDNAASQVLSLLNAWRVEQNLWPLKVNQVLETMALNQAAYVAPKLDSIQDESGYHLDAQGHMPQQRAAQVPYNWPHYRIASQIEIGENAAVGSPQFAINFWKGSDIHRRAALSNVYREVGVAAVPTKLGFLFIVDFGARPGILTALVNGTGDALFLSDERSPYAALSPTSAHVRLFDAQGMALTDTVPWTPTITLPRGSSGNIQVLYTNDNYQALSEVNLSSDRAVLPSNQVAAVPTTTPGAQPTAQIAAVPTATPGVQPTTQPTTQASAAPTTTPILPTATPSNVSIILTYNRRTLTLYNNARTPIDLSGFSVGNGAGKVGIQSWSKVAPIPAGAFPAGHCLQIQILNVPADTPANCRAVRAEVTLPVANVFWTQGAFEVKQGAASLVICQADAGRCEVNWSPIQR